MLYRYPTAQTVADVLLHDWQHSGRPQSLDLLDDTIATIAEGHRQAFAHLKTKGDQ